MSMDVTTVVDVKLGRTVSSTKEGVTYCEAVLSWKDKSCYTGIVVVERSQLGSVTGKGIFKCDQGVFEGHFVSGKLEGQGKLVLPNGNVFEGVFVNGRREGKGKLTTDDTVIHGLWLDDELNGWALRIYSSGSLERAFWECGTKDPWSVRREFSPGLKPLVVYMYAGAYPMQPIFEIISRGLNIPCISPLNDAYLELRYMKKPTEVQKNLMTLIERGKCPRRPLIEMARRRLDHVGGCGVLLNFPATVEEAELLREWGYEVAVFVVVHLTPDFIAAKWWRVKNPKVEQTEMPKLEPSGRHKELVSKFYARVAPLIDFYVDEYMPVRDNINIIQLRATLRKKFCLMDRE